MIKKKQSTSYTPTMQEDHELPAYFETYLESKFAVIEQKFEEIATIKHDIAFIKRLLIGDDGENSLVNRVANLEKNVNDHKKEASIEFAKFEDNFNSVKTCLNPEKLLDRPVKVKHMIVFGLILFVISIAEVREAVLSALAGMLALLPLVL